MKSLGPSCEVTVVRAALVSVIVLVSVESSGLTLLTHDAGALRSVLAADDVARPAGQLNSDWPSFRGEFASGVRDGAALPDEWNVENGKHVRWTVPIPGLGHCSPVIWDDSVFVTSAISSAGNRIVQTGLIGTGDASRDRSVQKWVVYCIDRATGKIRWQRVAAEGKPKDKRHTKATYANSTPATDGRHVVALFGSEGLHCFDFDGERIWSKDFGRLDAGAYDIPTYEWGTGSSPIIYKNLVIVQVDTQDTQFVSAINIQTGETVWRTDRDELPSWATPTIFERDGQVELVVNGSNFIRGYDPLTGKELWKLGGSSKIAVPTPIHHAGLMIVCSGRHPEAPLFAIRSGAKGDISLAAGQIANDFVAWSQPRRGPYISTPIAYCDQLFVLDGNGVLDCYGMKDGKLKYRKRIPHKGGGFTASPVAADGKLYLASEDGDVSVVRVDPDFKILNVNAMNQPIFATPAIAGQSLFVRTTQDLFSIGN